MSLDTYQLLPNNYAPVYESGAVRGYAMIAGVQCKFKSAQMKFNAHGATDTATLVVPITGNPDWTQQINNAANPNAPIYAQIYAGFTAPATGIPSYSLRFNGCVETYECDELSDIATFELRSLAMPLIANKLTTPFPGQTMSTIDFIQQQAAKYGLGTNINVASYGTLQDVLASEFITGVRNWCIWDLMLQCAQYDDVDIWVDRNGVLNYQAAWLVNRTNIALVRGQNLKNIVGKHSPQYNKNIKIVAKSYVKRYKSSTRTNIATGVGGGVVSSTSTRQVTTQPIFGTLESVTTSTSSTGQKSITVSSASGGPSSGFTSIASESGQEVYPIFPSSKDPTQCQQMAQNLWRQISMHEIGATLSIAVQEETLPNMDVTALLDVSGSRFSKFNTQYWPREIDETINESDGWTWEIQALNHTLPMGQI